VNWPDLLRGRLLPLVMGILNVTPDSFSDGGEFLSPDRAVERGRRMAEEGADLIDVGGESTRPASYGIAREVPAGEEIERVVPVIERLASLAVPISIDTRKSAVARAAISAGASVVNDVTAFRFDEGMARTVLQGGAAAILMHMRGTDPARMQEDIPPGDPLPGVLEELGASLAAARCSGLPAERLAVDPGLGFGKTPDQSLRLLAKLPRLQALGRPIVVGASRKGFVRIFSGIPEGSSVAARLAGSLACAAAAARAGAAVLRVHDVGATVRLLEAGRRSGDWTGAAESAGAARGPFEAMAEAIRDSRMQG
jgi:dihydropteroate synthase